MNPIWIVLICILCIYGIYRLGVYVFTPKTGARIGKEQIDLSKKIQVVASEELKSAWTSTSGSTLAFYIMPIIKDRSSVSGNEYANVLQIGTKQNFKLLIAPDAGRGDVMAPAILEVFVKGSNEPEKIEIPNVPLQRWTGVAIVKQGRKFNIYINGKLSVSHMCTAMPDFDDTQPLRAGDPRLEGTIGLLSLDPYPLQVADIKALYENTSDNSGKPYISSGSSFPIPTMGDLTAILSIGCPGGNCMTPKQTGPMEQWTSPYA